MAANRLARWTLTLNQYDYTIEYRRTAALHGDTDALSRLPCGPDDAFDEEDGEDVDIVCTIRTISTQLKPADPDLLRRETSNTLYYHQSSDTREKDGLTD